MKKKCDDGLKPRFSENLKKLMVKKCSRELRNRLGCSPQAFWQYMNGVALPSVENLIVISDYFGTSVNRMLADVVELEDASD